MKTAGFRGIFIAVVLFSVCAECATVDDAKIAAAGIRKLDGRHLTLYTDLVGEEIDRLPAVFDLAFPKYCRYFKVDESKHADWRMTGCLMKDKKRFADAGLLPDDLPPFEHGYSRGHELWLYDQPSDYYRRHLLLHEGVHGFMNTVLGSCGPPWYMEGIAEYIATHHFADGRLTLGYMPKNREEAPMWGRIRIVQDAEAKNHQLSLKQVMEFPEERRVENEFYAWCWTAAAFFDRHPRYQQRFRKMIEFVQKRDFDERFLRSLKDDWNEMCEEWRVMTDAVEYGYDVARSAIDFTPAKIALDASGSAKVVNIAADRGWQNTGLRLQAGEKYELIASGRYQVATVSAGPSGKEKIWWCEPNGVSIRYYRGRPLGVLLAAVRPDEPDSTGDSALLHPTVVGLGAELSPTKTGTLFLKINESAGELSDNSGKLQVKVRRSNLEPIPNPKNQSSPHPSPLP